MRTLILTEKPSVARDFARALGIQGKGNGFLEGKDYVVTWAVGHLLVLAEPQDYDVKWEKWNIASLPILPEHLKYNPIPNVKEQLGVVRAQLERKDIERVVVATDAGREGEVIARTILQTVDLGERPVYRFWTSQALTPQVIAETLEGLLPASRYDRLWHAGQARQIADWLVGMNFSRAATLKMRRARGDVFSVGRVQTAVLALLVDRRRERENFKPEPYWILHAHFSNERGTWRGVWFKGDEGRFVKKEDAERIKALVVNTMGKVESVKREKKKQVPPLLYSLTDLQREANNKFGLSAIRTLEIAQRLYEEKKCLSYPRTDSKVLGSRNVDMARGLVEKLSGAYPQIFEGVVLSRISLSNKRVFNDARLTDHHALIPLKPLPSNASGEERQIYELVLKRFAAAFHADYEYEATEVITEAQKETFRTRGKRSLVPGWKAVYGLKKTARKGGSVGDGGASGTTVDAGASPGAGSAGGGGDDEIEEENLPRLVKGDPAKVEDVTVEDEMTQPPPEYTEDLLLKDMTNPSRYVSEEELQKIFRGDVGLGTQATRAQIIETLLRRQYVEREKKKLAATDKGCLLIENLRRFRRVRAIAMPEETARWEMELEKIAMGVGDQQAFMADIRKFVRDGVEEFKMNGSEKPEKSENLEKPEKVKSDKPLGKCPGCGGEVIEGKRGFGCSNWREENGGCRFVIWKEMAGRKIDHDTVRVLLAGETTESMQFTSKEGREFSASLKLEEDEGAGKWMARFQFAGQGAANGGQGSEGDSSGPASMGTCPRCGGAVVEGKKGYGCSNWREQDGGCKFVIWKEIARRPISRDVAQELLEKGETEVLNGFISRAGKEFSAKLRLEGEEYKATFVF